VVMRLYIDMHSRLSYRGKFEFGEWCKSMVPMKERARGLGIGVASTSSDDGLKIRLRQPRKPELFDLRLHNKTNSRGHGCVDGTALYNRTNISSCL